MRVCVVRAGGRTSIGAHAGPIKPWLNVAALPDAAAGAFCARLSSFVSSFRKMWPVERKTAVDQPFAEIGAAGRTGRNGPAVWIQVHGHTVDWTPRNEGIQIIRSLRAA